MFDSIIEVFSVILTALYNLTDKAGFPSYGLAIILLTVIIKVALYPLTKKQLQSMKAMQRIAPELKKLQEKHKDNPQLIQQKMMALYQREGINPLAGCLPLILQMPILMAMYYALFNFDYATADPSFLWIENLSAPDGMYILPVISAFTTWLQQKISMTDVTPQARIMMVVMPLFIGWISLTFPAGLVLYWATMNVVQIIQQALIMRNS